MLLKARVACSSAWILKIELAFGTMIVKTSTTKKIQSPSLRRSIEPESTNEEIKIFYYAARFPSSGKLAPLSRISMPCFSLFCGPQALGSRELFMYVCKIDRGVQIFIGGLLEAAASCIALLMTSGFLNNG